MTLEDFVTYLSKSFSACASIKFRINMSKLYLWSEFVAIFFIMPLLYFFELIPIHKSIPLVVVFLYCLAVMYSRRNLSRRIFRIKSFYSLKEVAMKSLFLLVVSSLWVYIFREDVFFHLPLNNFWIWVFVIFTVVLVVSIWRLWENKTPKL